MSLFRLTGVQHKIEKMSKKQDNFTILIFSGIVGKCVRFTVGVKTIKFLSIGIITVLSFISISSVIFINKYLTASEELKELAALRRQTSEQRKEINFFVKKIRVFEKQMAKLEKFDKKLRVITSIGEPNGPTAHIMGIGGPEKNEFDIMEDDGSNFMPADMGTGKLVNSIERLYDEANTQLLSFQRLDEFFKDQELLLASTPTIWPIRGWVTSAFGYRKSPFTGLREVHEGLDIATEINSDIVSPADGIVIRTAVENGYGKILEIDHGYGIVTRYGHNSRHLVKVGDRVERGQPIARVGNTGLSTGPHVHYEVLVNGVPVDPFKFLLEE